MASRVEVQFPVVPIEETRLHETDFDFWSYQPDDILSEPILGAPDQCNTNWFTRKSNQDYMFVHQLV